MNIVLQLLTFTAGAALILQIGMNATLSRSIGGNPFGAVLVSFSVGTLGALLLLFVTRSALLPTRAQLAAVPAWAWFAGVIGAFYVAVVTIAGPRVGALLVVALTVAGQMCASLLVDHFGVLGFPQLPITATKLLGVALLFAGVLLVAR